MTGPVIDDFIILGVPDDANLENDDTCDRLERIAELNVIGQYHGRKPRALLYTATEWKITSDWREVEAFQPAHDCAQCTAANDQAMAYLKEHPEKRIALGNLHYVEVW
jgi:hypothetical protein